MRISTADFIRNYGAHADLALTSPITVTKHGQDRLVILSAAEYDRLTGRGRRTVSPRDLADGDGRLFGVAEARTSFRRRASEERDGEEP